MVTRIVYGSQNGPYNYSKFIIDNEEDIAMLPTSVKNGLSGDHVLRPCSIGSTAIITNERKKYILNNQNQWTLLENYAVSANPVN